MTRVSVLIASLVVATSLAPAIAQERDAPDPAPLVFVRVNDHGAEEWLRAQDGALVIRVPGGSYLRRPYEGAGTTMDPEEVDVPSLFMDRTEVTNARYARFLNTLDDVTNLVDTTVAGLVRDDAGAWRAAPGLERHPVTAATGHGALAYADWVGGAIPSPDQWMKAAGGSNGHVYPWGADIPTPAHANFAQPSARGPQAVGSYAAGASPYGCLDMAGNVYDRVLVPGRRQRESRAPVPAMLKGGSWVTPHALNLRVLDLCMQPLDVADRTVGFRVVMADPEPDRPTRTVSAAPVLRVATDWDLAVAEARRRRVPIFLSLLFDTCGQCDRTREQCYRDPRFIAYANAHLVVVIGHAPGDAMDDPHRSGADGACSLYPRITCDQHVQTYRRGLAVVGGFAVSPGNFVLDPDRTEKGAGADAVLVGERELPKWGNAVDAYLAAFEDARAQVQ